MIVNGDVDQQISKSQSGNERELGACRDRVRRPAYVWHPTVSLPEKQGCSSIRARAQFSQPGTGIFEAPPWRSTLQKSPPRAKSHLKPSGFEIVDVSRTSTAITTAKMADSDSPVTLRTRKFIRNPLLGRKQMVV